MAEDDVEKGKKKRKRRSSARLYENLNKPVRSRSVAVDEMARDEEMCAGSDVDKGIAPAGNPFTFPGNRNPMDRVSPSRVTGGQAPSTGDHGGVSDPMNVPGPRELAFRHPSMRMGVDTANGSPMVTLRTQNQDRPDAEIIFGHGRVSMSRIDAAAASGMSSAPGNPASRQAPHIAPLSAVAPNGGHLLGDPRSHAAPRAVKASEAREILKRHMFGGNGAR